MVWHGTAPTVNQPIDSLPNELAGDLLSDGGGTVYARFFYSGSDVVGAYNALQPMLNSPYLQGLAPLQNYTSMAQAVRANADPSEQMWSRTFVANAFLLPQQGVLNNVSRLIGASQPPMALWMTYGGAVRTGTTGSVPGGMRAAMYEVLFGDRWYDPAQDETRMTDLTVNYLPVLYGYGTASYNNEYTTWGNKYNVLDDWKTRFFNNYDSLLHVKQKYDPCNAFTVKFGIGSDLPTATC